MLENWGISMDRVHVFLRDNAFNMKAGICMLESSSAPCFIHTLQLIIKDSLFLENKISVLIAKPVKLLDILIILLELARN